MDQELRKRAGAGGQAPATTASGTRKPSSPPSSSSPTRLVLFAATFFLLVNVLYPLDPAVSIVDPIKRREPEPNQTPQPLGAVESVVEDRFPCGNQETCHAWLVIPKQPLKAGGSSAPPVVVMGHGLACMKDMGLYTYAVEFAQIGVASYMIDYRGFGLSDGEPRNLVDAAAHAEDFIDAVKHVAADGRVDGSRIALWGTSLSGGHVVLAAGRLGDKIRAVISQAPALDAVQNFVFNLQQRGLLSMLRVVCAAVVDFLRGVLGMTPAYITIFGRADELAALPLSQAELDQYFAIHSIHQDPPRPYLGGWVNKTPPRTLLTFLLYRPVLYASQVHGPVLYVVSDWDSVVPAEMVDAALPLSPHPRTRKLKVEGGHFQLYKETVHLTLPDMVKFLQEELA